LFAITHVVILTIIIPVMTAKKFLTLKRNQQEVF